MKILLPTDFSTGSKIAIEYAIQLGIKFNAELILISVVNISGPARGSLQARDLEELLVNDARNECVTLLEQLKSEGVINYEYIGNSQYKKLPTVDNF